MIFFVFPSQHQECGRGTQVLTTGTIVYFVSLIRTLIYQLIARFKLIVQVGGCFTCCTAAEPLVDPPCPRLGAGHLWNCDKPEPNGLVCHAQLWHTIDVYTELTIPSILLTTTEVTCGGPCMYLRCLLRRVDSHSNCALNVCGIFLLRFGRLHQLERFSVNNLRCTLGQLMESSHCDPTVGHLGRTRAFYKVSESSRM